MTLNGSFQHAFVFGAGHKKDEDLRTQSATKMF